ncbi:Calcium-dependent protein kinase 7 [Zea mays]|uniref:Calcium-dependent protein kinase 7 n=1 Tax=Zea mays TaxID=4577 RepID=A0A1D6JRA0_MAIZE|nr:Calcium-dependent protein kinase 7 [Zea mays]
MAVVDAMALSTPTPARAEQPDITRCHRGGEVREGDLVQFNYVCRRANDYFVHRCVVEFPDAIALLFDACTGDACYTAPDFESDRVQIHQMCQGAQMVQGYCVRLMVGKLFVVENAAVGSEVEQEEPKKEAMAGVGETLCSFMEGFGDQGEDSIILSPRLKEISTPDRPAALRFLETEQGVAQAIIRFVIDFKRDPWPRVSDNAKDLVRGMLNPDQKRRLTAHQVLGHPWLQNIKKAPNVNLGETVKARLKQFSVMNKFKKHALRVIAEHLWVEEAADIKDMFEKMDLNKDQMLSFEELKLGLHKFGQQMPDADVQTLMEAADADGNGSLNYGEFVTLFVHLRKIGNDEHMHKAFAYFDRNQSDYIEIDELRESLADDLGQNREEIINAIIRDVDTDKDGKISYDEFATMMKAGTYERKASRQYSRKHPDSTRESCKNRVF